MKKIPSIVLASASPRRKEILTHLGLEPKIVVSDADETVNESVTPEALTEILSKRKAQAVKELVASDELVIASDTVVAKGDTVFGKPHSKKPGCHGHGTLAHAVFAAIDTYSIR